MNLVFFRDLNNKEKSPVRMKPGRSKISLLLIIGLTLFLSACSSKRPSVTEALAQNKVEDSGCFYDISEMVANAAQGEILCGCALRDKETLLILSEDDRNSYKARLIDLPTGDVTNHCSFEAVGTVPAPVKILSVNPLIVYDKDSSVIYRPEPGKEQENIIIPQTLAEAEPVIANGKVYLSTTKGILYKAQDNGFLEEFWRMPYQCSWMAPQVQQDGVHLLFSTHPDNNPEQSIYANLDPRTMEVAFYSSGKNDLYYATYSDGRYSSLSVDIDPSLRVWDPEQNTVYSFPIPDSIASDAAGNGSYFGTEGGSVLLACPNPVAGDLFAFTISDQEERPQGVFLCDILGKNASEIREWHLPEKGIYTFPSNTYGDLSEKAQELYEKYGVTIVLGKNVPKAFPDYTVNPEESEMAIQNALSLLEDALSLYPEGYFKSLCSIHYRDIVIYLAGEMTPLLSDTYISDAGAFTTDQNGVARVALNLDSGLYRGMIIHELTHVTDYALLGEDLLPEEDWASFNPADFYYYDSYIDILGRSYEESGSTQYTAAAEEDLQNIYFYDAYSRTFALEDRARLMEVLLRDADPGASAFDVDPCFGSSHLKAKINWYSSILRKSLGTAEWPSETVWEKAIKNADVVSENADVVSEDVVQNVAN